VFSGTSLDELVAHLEERQASVFHTCQLHDLPSYFGLGGIPSHAHLEAHRARYTPMDTDFIDKVNGVWGKVFVNLADFGRVFAQGGCATPSCFGPVNIQIHPAALLEAEDVAICLRSAGAEGFDRRRESLTEVAQVDRLFRYPAASPFPRSIEFKVGDSLKNEFGRSSVPELSCTVTSGRLSLDRAVVIWVDPYSVNGEALVDQVCGLVNQYGLNCCVKERFCRQERKPLYNEFAHLAMKGMYTLDAILASPEISDELRAFLGDLQARGPLYQLDRYLRYLRSGTLNSTGKTSGTGQRT
jgi:hypothetical protein